MTPPDLGTYTVASSKCVEVAFNNMTDDVRRRDIPIPSWYRGAAGPARVTHTEPMDNLAQLASFDMRPTEVMQTEQGPIVLGKGPVANVTWHPSVADLQMAPMVDTRRTAISDRYFR